MKPGPAVEMTWLSLPCLVTLTLLLAVPASAQLTPTQTSVPAELDALLQFDAGDLEQPDFGLRIRRDAMREAALSFGARGGLSHRAREISERLQRHANRLDATFDFRRLALPAPSGLLIEPPVVTQAESALVIGQRGQTAAVADLILRINDPARLISAPRSWRTYLERDFGPVEPPPAVLLPRDDEERALWRGWVTEGWNLGIEQAQAIYEADLNRLLRDFNGMVRYRGLLAQGMITEPFADLEDRGITGGGNEMRVGDRGVRITGPSQLNPRGERWTPAQKLN